MNRRKWFATLLAAALAGCGTLWLENRALAGKADGRLDLYFVDCEGGAAVLIVTPAGESVLVDTGYPTPDDRDTKRIVHVVRDVAGLDHVDHSIATHWHLDHFANLVNVAARVPVRQFWDRGFPFPEPKDARTRRDLQTYRRVTAGLSKPLRAGDRLPLTSTGTPLSLQVVVASRQVIPNEGPPNPFAHLHRPKPVDKSDNAESIGFLLQFGRFKFVSLADLTWNVEAKLVTPNNPLGQVDLFMVDHHGFAVSNNPVLVWALDPRVSVLCNGPTKGGDRETLETIRRARSFQALYQLHRNLRLPLDVQAPAKFIANWEPTDRCRGAFIRVSVSEDGSQYEVAIDGKPESRRTFRTR